MKRVAIALFALALVGCEGYSSSPQQGLASQVVVGVDGKVKVIDPDGNLVSPVPCGRDEQPCRSLDKDGKLISLQTVGIAYTELDNPHCCYLFEFDGKYEELCWALPAGQRCPRLN